MLKLLLDALPMVKEIERGLGHGATRKTTIALGYLCHFTTGNPITSGALSIKMP